MKPIYLDHHATTPLDPRVFTAMEPYFKERFGNASSATHPYGWQAADAVDKARDQVAKLIGAKSKEIIFTSGATESNNLALFGVSKNIKNEPQHIITTQVEHPSVLRTAEELQEQGVEVTYLPVTSQGQIELSALENSIKPHTKLISVIFANNEIGTINPAKEIGAIAKKHGIIFHADAAQAVGKVKIDVEALGIDLLSISAHKIYGPKGIGAIYIRSSNPRIKLKPQMFGASQERSIRPGTLNVPGIIGLGKACDIYELDMETEEFRLKALRDKLEFGLRQGIDNITINGHPSERLSVNLNVSFAGVQHDMLLQNLAGLAVSSGAACSSAAAKISHVLKAIGVSDELARGTIRFAIGRFTTTEEIERAVEIVTTAIKKCREASTFHMQR